MMMKFGSVGIFSVFEGNPNCQTIPGIDLQRNYNLAEVERSLWGKLKLRLWWLNPRVYNRATERYTKTVAQYLKEVLAEFEPDLVIADMWAYCYVPTIEAEIY